VFDQTLLVITYKECVEDDREVETVGGRTKYELSSQEPKESVEDWREEVETVGTDGCMKDMASREVLRRSSVSMLARQCVWALLTKSVRMMIGRKRLYRKTKRKEMERLLLPEVWQMVMGKMNGRNRKIQEIQQTGRYQKTGKMKQTKKERQLGTGWHGKRV